MEKTETSNPMIEPNNEEVQQPMYDEYAELEKQMAQSHEKQQQNQTRQQEETPDTALGAANLLMSNSETTKNLPEIDKEFTLTNFNKDDLAVAKLHIHNFYGMEHVKKVQTMKLIELEMMQGKLDEDSKDVQLMMIARQVSVGLFDDTNIRKGILSARLSRGKNGFERQKQVETISTQTMDLRDRSETKPSFMDKMKGGMKR